MTPVSTPHPMRASANTTDKAVSTRPTDCTKAYPNPTVTSKRAGSATLSSSRFAGPKVSRG